MRHLVFIALLFFWNTIHSQIGWTWEKLDSMPMRISNNSVAYGVDDFNSYVFSFGGIDSTKIHSGITNRAFRYTIGTDSWEEIDPLPFSQTNIASAASTVRNKIYIIGGYHVNPDGSEVSSNEVIRYDPATNTYLTNGLSIPTPIDDHVQCVWRDSLIFVITGWSNTGNVELVQIYDTELDTWTAGTPTPDNNFYKAFGASGEIIGDTIYYYGGASMGANFPARNFLRKGVINPENPAEITWTILDNGPNTLYRSAALKYGDNLFWVGGSSISYNYNGIAYNGSGGVPPLTQIMRYNHLSNFWHPGEGAPYGVMDLRGIAQIGEEEWIICGGMESDQRVSNQVYLLTYDPVVGGITSDNKNQRSFWLNDNQIILTETAVQIDLFTPDGKLIEQLETNSPVLPENLSGLYLIRVRFEDHTEVLKFVR